MLEVVQIYWHLPTNEFSVIYLCRHQAPPSGVIYSHLRPDNDLFVVFEQPPRSPASSPVALAIPSNPKRTRAIIWIILILYSLFIFTGQKSSLPTIPTISYTVGNRDTLTSVAARFDTTPSELTHLNRLNSSFIYPGQQLLVPDKSAKDDASSSSTNDQDGGSLSGKSSPVERKLSGDESREKGKRRRHAWREMVQLVRR